MTEHLERTLEELGNIVSQVSSDLDLTTAKGRLERWKLRAVSWLSENISVEEGQRLAQKRLTVHYFGAEFEDFIREAELYQAFIIALIEDSKNHPTAPKRAQSKDEEDIPKYTGRQRNDANSIFVVHGHDSASRLALEKLLKERWKLETVVLSDEPGKGRTLIEKFEDEAEKVGAAIVLLTPDDQIETGDGRYTQARPNVTFELGWFYGRLGRGKVCIICKRGTRIHSDLDGINRIDFEHTIEDAFLSIERELKGMGLI